MNLLLPLAALLGLEVESITERVRTAVMLNTVMALFGLIGLVFLLVAAHLALTGLIGALYSALIIAGVFLLLALIVWLGNRSAQARHRRDAAEKRRSSETSAFVTTAAVTALPAVLKSSAIRLLGVPAAAAAAAFILMRATGNTKK